jgi:hypothetical protein
MNWKSPVAILIDQHPGGCTDILALQGKKLFLADYAHHLSSR